MSTDVIMTPYRYAEMMGRLRWRMPTALGKVAGMCTPAELDRLELWHTQVAEVHQRMAQAAREGLEYELNPEERAMLDRDEDLQKQLWRWALGMKRKR